MKHSIRITSSKIRPVSLAELKAISTITKQAENLVYRPVSSLQSTLRNGRMFIALDKNIIIGWIEVYQLWEKWWGLSSLYVMPQYRDKGIGRETLLPAALEFLETKYVYAATTNQVVQKQLLKKNFVQTTFLSYPLKLIVSLITQRYKTLDSWVKLLKITQKPIKYFMRKPLK